MKTYKVELTFEIDITATDADVAEKEALMQLVNNSYEQLMMALTHIEHDSEGELL